MDDEHNIENVWMNVQRNVWEKTTNEAKWTEEKQKYENCDLLIAADIHSFNICQVSRAEFLIFRRTLDKLKP